MSSTKTPAGGRRKSPATGRRSVERTAPPEVFVRPQGRYERLAYERQERDLRAAYGDDWNNPLAWGSPPKKNKDGSAEPDLRPSLSRHPKGYWFDREAAERPIAFTERFCRHHKGEWAGKPLVLEEWQKFILRCVFGWKRADGLRRFRIAYEEVARKNGKSEKIAAIGNYLLVADGEPGAEIYSTATKEDQAKIVWGTSCEMVKRSPDLKKYITIRQKSLTCDCMTSVFKPLGADSDTLDGLNPHGHLCDEMHAHKKRGVFDVMITGMGARRQPMTFIITTAGVYDPESIGWEQHEHAQQVLDGVLEDDEYFAIIFAADEGDDPYAPSTWYKANPNLNVSVKFDYLQAQATRGQQTPTFLNTFLRLHLNVWTAQVTRWISPDAWNACDAPVPPIETLKGHHAYLALDLSTKLDITALAVDVPISDEHYGYWFFFVPKGRVQVQTREGKKPDYAQWVREGWLIETPGDVVDYGFIQKEILKLREIFKIVQLGYDPWNASHLSQQLQGEGFSVDPDAKKELLVEMRQGMKTLSEPSKEFEKLIVSRKYRHGNNPVMRWMVNNAVIRRDSNDNIAPDKSSASGKIDGVVASIMALGRAILQPVRRASVYDTRGVRSFHGN